MRYANLLKIHSGPRNASVILGYCFLFIILFECGPSSGAGISKTTSPQRFKVILRVLRPQWRKTPPAAKADSPLYSAILGADMVVENPESDTQVLDELSRLHPTFRFRIRAEKVFVLEADKIWEQPANFSLNHVKFAIVDKNRDILNEGANSIKSAIGFDPARKGRAVAGSPVDYKLMFPAERIDQLHRQNKLLLYSDYQLFCKMGSEKLNYLNAYGPRIMLEGSTIFLNYKLFVIKKSKPGYSTASHVYLAATDVLLLTVIKQK